MRTTVTLEKELVAEAERLTGKKGSELMNEALRALITRESGRRLALLGATEPQLRQVPRRRLS